MFFHLQTDVVGLAVLLWICIVAAHHKAVAGETRLLCRLNSNWSIIATNNCQATTDRHCDGTAHQKAADCMEARRP